MSKAGDAVRVLKGIWDDAPDSRELFRGACTMLAWQVWKRTVAKPIVIDLFNGCRFIAHPDCQASSAILYHGIPERADIEFLRRHIKGGTLIDVGAHVGSVSLLLSDVVEHAVLFEPNPIATARARENLALNRLPFDVYEIALSDDVGETAFEDRGGVSGCNRVIGPSMSTEFSTRRVRRSSLDAVLDADGRSWPRITAIKVDVEGHENAVFRGMRRCLERSRPGLIMFEYLQRTDLRETVALLQSVGYLVFRRSADGFVQVLGSAQPLQNLFACPVELFQAFSETVALSAEAVVASGPC